MALSLKDIQKRLLDKIDRDKQMPGLQAIPGGFSGGVNRVQTAFRQNPAAFNVFTPLRQTMTSIGNYKMREDGPTLGQAIQATSPTVARDFGNYMRSASLAQLPGVKNVANMAAQTSEAIGSGVTNIATGAGRTIMANNPMEVLGGGFKTLKGIGQVGSAATPIFQLANVATSLPQLDKNDRIRRFSSGIAEGMTGIEGLTPNVQSRNTLNVPLLGEIDPFKAPGAMIGYTRNPVNRKIFKGSEKLFPTGGNFAKWITTTAARGGLENIILEFDRIADAPEDQKAQAVLSVLGEGAVSEIIGQGLIEGAGKGLKVSGKVIGSALDSKPGQYTTKQLAQVADYLNKNLRQFNTPVKQLEFNPKTQRSEYVTKPMWQWMLQDQTGAIGKQPDYMKDQPTKGIEQKAQINQTGIQTPQTQSGQVIPLQSSSKARRVPLLGVEQRGTPIIQSTPRSQELNPGQLLNQPLVQSGKTTGLVSQGNDSLEAIIADGKKQEIGISGNNLRKYYQPQSTQTPVQKVPETTNQNPAVKIKTPQEQGLVPVIKPESRLVGTSDQLPLMTPSQNTSLQAQKSSSGIVPPLSNTQTSVGGQLNNNKKSFSYNKLDELYTQFVDRFHPISKLAKKGGQDKDMARTLARYYGSGSTAKFHLEAELSPILQKHDVKDLTEAAIAMRDIELNSRGIKGSPEQKQAQAKLQALTEKLGKEKMAELGETLQQLYAYQDNMVKKYLVDTGIMSQESYQAMRQNNQFYIPMKRVMEEVDEMLGIPVNRGAGSVGKQNVIYGIKGSDREVVDPVQSIVENTYKLVSLGRRQDVATKIAGLRQYFPELIQRVKESDQFTTISLFENGKKVYYKVPEEIAESARGMGEEQLIMLAQILKVPTDLFRTMTTGINPEFLLPNVARDLQSAFTNTGTNPLKFVAGLAHLIKQDDVYKQFLESGGLTTRISTNRNAIKTTARELASPKKFSLEIKSPKDIFRGLELLGQFSEEPTRLAVWKDAYDKAVKSGMSHEEALKEAAYWSQEGTVNFARRGSKMTNINAIYAYLNARVQGIDRMFRSAKSDPAGFTARIGFGFVAPSLALYAWNTQHPDYYNERIISQRDKTDNFIFMLPGEGVNGIRYIKLPKAEVGKIVNPIESFLDFTRNKGGDVWSTTWDTLKSFSPIDDEGGLIPTAIKPIVEQAANRNFYFDSEIVPDYKKGLPAGYQDSNYTAPLYRMIGQNAGVSPARLQHLSESYLGGMSRLGEMATRPLVPDQYKTKQNERGAVINQTPIFRRFAGGEKMSELEFLEKQKNTDKFIKGQITTVKNNMKKGSIPVEAGEKQIIKLQKQLGGIRSGSGDMWESYFELPEYNDLPTGTNQQKAIKEDKRTKLLSKIMSDEDVDLDTQVQLANKLGENVTKSDVEYFQIARLDNDIKTGFVLDELGNMESDKHMEYLATLRVPVMGKMVLADGVIDDLYDQGLVSDAEKKFLKNLDYVKGKDGKYTLKQKTSKPKKFSVKTATVKSTPILFKSAKRNQTILNLKPSRRGTKIKGLTQTRKIKV